MNSIFLEKLVRFLGGTQVPLQIEFLVTSWGNIGPREKRFIMSLLNFHVKSVPIST